MPTGARGRRRLPSELADQPEVDVQHVTRVEPGEQVLAVRVDPFDDVLVEQAGALGEPSLRRRHRDLVALKVAPLVLREPVERVAFGQRSALLRDTDSMTSTLWWRASTAPGRWSILMTRLTRGAVSADLVDARLDERHDLVPLTLDVGEHRIRLVRQTRRPERSGPLRPQMRRPSHRRRAA